MSQEQGMEQANDATLLQEVIDNRRIIEHPDLGRLTIVRPTPRDEMNISEQRRQQFQRDIVNDDILSRSELEEIYNRRGIWSDEKTARMNDLSRRLSQLMIILDGTGFDSAEDLQDRYSSLADRLEKLFEDDEDLALDVQNFFDPDRADSSKIRARLLNSAPSSDVEELLDQADKYKAHIDLLKELGDVKRDLNELQQKAAKLFVGTVESRADQTERLAKIYFCCRDADTGETLWDEFDDIMDADPEIIDFLQEELYLFENGITDDMRGMFAKYGFIRRAPSTNGDSDDSPAPDQSSSDGESPETPPATSSE